ncbi:hypothetical protein E4T48_04452 [Aureobasidium sp. EXF-10727]|nr:hypothetical protein E4T48_04452 [Aureobasidium sp. EXF-10727]
MSKPTDEEIEQARQDWEPEYPSGDEKRFQGSQAEQAQNQRTVTQQKKHNEYYNQEKRQTGTVAQAQKKLLSPSNQSTNPFLGLQTERSRSSSRRARRKRVKNDQRDGKYMHTNSLEALEEADANGELHEMQPFERIGPDSTSMDGPVTKARADRGEIPMRGSNPNQPYYKKPPQQESSLLDETDGLKLKLDANLDVEIELKASIRGDLTLSLL